MIDSNGNGDRRSHPRIIMDLPLEYRIFYTPFARGALTVDASKTGLLIQSVSDLPVGTELSLVILFPKKFELKDLKVLAEIVRKERYLKEDWEGFQYGLRFTEVEEEDLVKLQELLSGGLQTVEISSPSGMVQGNREEKKNAKESYPNCR
jgi:hypothetical protein